MCCFQLIEWYYEFTRKKQIANIDIESSISTAGSQYYGYKFICKDKDIQRSLYEYELHTIHGIDNYREITHVRHNTDIITFSIELYIMTHEQHSTVKIKIIDSWNNNKLTRVAILESGKRINVTNPRLYDFNKTIVEIERACPDLFVVRTSFVNPLAPTDGGI